MPAAAEAPAEPTDRALQMLALLQREGRLVDFLFEDISSYPDAQIGAAVRRVHGSCREAIEHYIKLAPIINSEEDQPVTLHAGIDAASIKLIGNVSSGQPVRGVLRHRGWQAVAVRLPSLPEGAGRKVIAAQRKRLRSRRQTASPLAPLTSCRSTRVRSRSRLRCRSTLLSGLQQQSRCWILFR